MRKNLCSIFFCIKLLSQTRLFGPGHGHAGEDVVAFMKQRLGDAHQGSVQPAWVFSPHAPSSTALADLDGDGDQDILSVSTWDSKVAYYENLGGGEERREEVGVFFVKKTIRYG